MENSNFLLGMGLFFEKKPKKGLTRTKRYITSCKMQLHLTYYCVALGAKICKILALLGPHHLLLGGANLEYLQVQDPSGK